MNNFQKFCLIMLLPYFPSEQFSIFLFSTRCEVLGLFLWLDDQAWGEHLTTLLDR